MFKSTLAGLCMLLPSYAFADEVVIHPGVVPGVAVHDHDHDGDRVRDHDRSGCASTTVHKENDEGDSKTVKKTDCD